ncbi:MAG: endonuclease/exonuclease/phosphatase family protein [Mesonia sp.]|uniref:endonuclease/exonuclease/phosphatase family protein n=1 Tax=Mesonia sp. TaxID=1960830 RepID=UPI003241FC1B
MILKTVFRVLVIIAVLLTVFPFFAADAWYIRMFDYPHVQLTFLTLFIGLFYFFKFEYKNWKDYLFLSALTICLVVQAIKIYPYTPFAPLEVNASTQEDDSLKMYIANVLQKNKEYEKVIQQIKDLEPDLILLTETDQKWVNKINTEFSKNYKYKVEVPLPNTYGMLLYTKYPLENQQVNYLIEDSIPSINAQLNFHDQLIDLHSIHPKPPMPQHAKTSDNRDAEMMLVAKKVLKKEKLPALVMGDFNDVAWSTTTTLFQEVSKLLDVRKGRGFFNTYDANSYLMRWPLDHVFVSEEFRVQQIELLENNGSDHLPIYLVLTYEPEHKESQQQENPSSEEMEDANQQMD